MQKSKQISKNNSSNGQKKPYRQTFNNNNPHNKLSLNKFHQIQEPYQNVQKKSDAFVLHKKKRDLQRMMKHCESKGVAIDQTKKQQLQTIDTQLNSRRKKYEKQKRKEYFLQQKYSNIKHIQQRKAYKGLDDAKANTKLPETQRKSLIQQWQKKIRYIKNFPKTLKYISLFPSTKPLQGKSLQFQQKIMNDIQQEHKKKVTKLNYYKSQNEVSKKKVESSIMPMTNKEVVNKDGRKIKKVVDDFFVQEEESQEQQQQQERQNDQDMQEQSGSQQDMQVEDDEQSIQDDDE